MSTTKKKRNWSKVNRNCSKTIKFRLSDNEFAQIANAAERQSITIGAYARSILLNTPIPRQSRRPLAKKDMAIIGRYLGQLGRLSTYISQTTKSPYITQETLSVLTETKQLLLQIHSDLHTLLQQK